MKKLLLFIFGPIGIGILFTLLQAENRFKTYEEALEELMSQAPIRTYKDAFYGYTLPYPEFFAYDEEKGLSEEKGFVRFCFWDIERFVIEGCAAIDKELTSVETKMDRVAQSLHAEEKKVVDKDSFIVAGLVRDEDGYTNGYRYYTKYVRNHRVWFAYSFYYPARCRSSLQRMFRLIEQWNAKDEQYPILS